MHFIKYWISNMRIGWYGKFIKFIIPSKVELTIRVYHLLSILYHHISAPKLSLRSPYCPKSRNCPTLSFFFSSSITTSYTLYSSFFIPSFSFYLYSPSSTANSIFDCFFGVAPGETYFFYFLFGRLLYLSFSCSFCFFFCYFFSFLLISFYFSSGFIS